MLSPEMAVATERVTSRSESIGGSAVLTVRGTLDGLIERSATASSKLRSTSPVP